MNRCRKRFVGCYIDLSCVVSGHVVRIRELYSELITKLSAKNVAAKMFSLCGLTLKELEKIQNSRSPSEAAELLLKILLKAPYEVYECFTAALKETGQEDVYIWLAYKGNIRLYIMTFLDLFFWGGSINNWGM